MKFDLRARVVAEFLGTAFLTAAVIGSGIMGERLAGGNTAIALLANTIATGAACGADPDLWLNFRRSLQSGGDPG
jgi:glycerol uptake facilitator-like aquaporin